ncbi:hypothetical protein D3C76_1866190 [compost metagenome]
MPAFESFFDCLRGGHEFLVEPARRVDQGATVIAPKKIFLVERLSKYPRIRPFQAALQ